MLFSDHCNAGLFILKFYLLDHEGQDLLVLKTVSVIHAPPFEQYYVNIKQAYKKYRKKALSVWTRLWAEWSAS